MPLFTFHRPAEVSSNKRKRNQDSDDMPFFTHSNNFLSIPSRSRARTETRRHDDVEEFLSSDLELSFASTVSLNSPSRDPVLLTPESDYAEPMDISPAPALKPTHGRPRAFTSAARLFGNDMSNRISPNAAIEPSPSFHVESTRSSSSKRTQRAALPTQWLFSAKQDTSNSSVRSTSYSMHQGLTTSLLSIGRAFVSG